MHDSARNICMGCSSLIVKYYMPRALFKDWFLGININRAIINYVTQMKVQIPDYGNVVYYQKGLNMKNLFKLLILLGTSSDTVRIHIFGKGCAIDRISAGHPGMMEIRLSSGSSWIYPKRFMQKPQWMIPAKI